MSPLIGVLLVVLCVGRSAADPACSTVGQLKCKCVDLTYNCSHGGHPIMPIMLNPRLKTLILAHNQIRRIRDLNSLYISIEHLDISYNLLNSNESSIFESEKLKFLNLAHNHLTTINDPMFKGLPLLIELRLEGNRLTSLASFSFAKLVSLRVLHLEFNQIDRIRPDAFNGLKKLIELHLNNNRLMPALNGSLIDQILANRTVGESTNGQPVVELRRSIDELRRLIGGLVDSNPTHLASNGNPVHSVNSVNSFVNSQLNSQLNGQLSSQLNGHVDFDSHLNLQLGSHLNSQLNSHSSGQMGESSWPSGDLSALHLSNFNELKYLDLSNNPLLLLNGLNSPFSDRHPATKTNATSQLDTLLLNNCSLLAVDASSFSHLTNLVKLELNGNLLSEPPSRSFNDLGHLQELDVSRNPFESVQSHAFSPLTSLIKLKLNEQKYLNAIHPFAFDKLGKLEYLEMNSNLNLNALDHQLFAGLTNLQSLSLSNSSLSTLDPRLANLFKKLTWIQVSSRKFNCNCSVQWLNLLLNRLRQQAKPNGNSTDDIALSPDSKTGGTDRSPSYRRVPDLMPDESIVLCSLPESVSGANLADLTTEQLGCYEVKSLLPITIAIVIGLFILIAVIVLCVINCRSSSANCLKRNKHDSDDSLSKYNPATGDHLASLQSFGNGPSIINSTNNYAFKLGLYDNRTAKGKLRSQNKVFSMSDKPLIGELPRFDTMYKPPLIGSNNFSNILMPNSTSTLISTNKLAKPADELGQPMISRLTNPYQISLPVGQLIPPGYEQDYFGGQQPLLFQQRKTNTLHPGQLLNHFGQQANSFHTQRPSQRPLSYHNNHNSHNPNDDLNEGDFSDHTYATVLNGDNGIYVGPQEHRPDTINHTINPSHLHRRLGNSDCSSCSSAEPLSRLSNYPSNHDRPITEL